MSLSVAMDAVQLPPDADRVPRPCQPIGYFEERSGLWILAIAWLCQLSDGRGLIVHSMARSDGASIPRFLWPFVGPRYNACTFPAAFCHDMLYQGHLVARSQADAEFMRLLIAFGVSPVKARLYWLAVRSFGWMAWQSKSPDDIAQGRLFAEVIDP